MDTQKKIRITIIGSSGTIGSFLAHKYIQNGNIVNLSYRKKKQILKLKKFINYEKFKKKIKFFEFNIFNEKSIIKSIKKNYEIFSLTDILIITIAEQGEIENFFDTSISKFKKTISINFMSYLLFLRSLKTILKKKNMTVILFSGGGSTSYRKNFSSYSISKLCLVKLTEILSHEVKNKKTTFNIIAPGIINSKMTNQILKNKIKISKEELIKINENLQFTNENLNKVYKTINFLNSKKGKLISGRLISSSWDKIFEISKKKYLKLIKTDIYNRVY